MFQIHMGVPEMEEFWNTFQKKVTSGTAGKDEIRIFKKLGKAFRQLANDPRHPGLNSHEISSLSKRVGFKIWESYLENNTPAAGRIFWAYGPNRGDITIMGLEPHPDDKAKSYDKITLSSMGKPVS